MNFKHDKNAVYLGEDRNRPDAIIEFSPVEETKDGLNIFHTEIHNAELKGQGVAEKLLDEVAKIARNTGKKVKATCSYAKKKLEEEEKYHDIRL